MATLLGGVRGSRSSGHQGKEVKKSYKEMEKGAVGPWPLEEFQKICLTLEILRHSRSESCNGTIIEDKAFGFLYPRTFFCFYRPITSHNELQHKVLAAVACCCSLIPVAQCSSLLTFACLLLLSSTNLPLVPLLVFSVVAAHCYWKLKTAQLPSGIAIYV